MEELFIIIVSKYKLVSWLGLLIHWTTMFPPETSHTTAALLLLHPGKEIHKAKNPEWPLLYSDWSELSSGHYACKMFGTAINTRRGRNSQWAKVTFILKQRKPIHVCINYTCAYWSIWDRRYVCVNIWMCKSCIPSSSLTAVRLTISIEELDKGLPQANFPLWFEIASPFCLPHLEFTGGAVTSSPL